MSPSVLSSHCSSFWLNKDNYHETKQQGSQPTSNSKWQAAWFGGAVRDVERWHTHQVWWGQWAIWSGIEQLVRVIKTTTCPAICQVRHTGQHPFSYEERPAVCIHCRKCLRHPTPPVQAIESTLRCRRLQHFKLLLISPSNRTHDCMVISCCLH